jgi:hypothetical protein
VQKPASSPELRATRNLIGAKLKRRKLDLFRGVSVVEARREIIKSEELNFELRDL